MILNHMLLGWLFVLTGCLESPDPAQLSSTADPLDLSPPICPAVVCNPDGTCPTCNGVTPQCDTGNDCFYTIPGGGGGGGGSPPQPPESM